MDYGKLTPEGMKYLLYESYRLTARFYHSEAVRDIYPERSVLFTSGQFPGRKQIRNLTGPMKAGEQILITDKLYVSWIFACTEEGYWLLGPFKIQPVSTSMLNQALGSLKHKETSSAAFREYHSQLPRIDGDRLNSMLNIFLQFTKGSPEPSITWLSLYMLQEEMPADKEEYGSHIRRAFEMEREYMDSVYMGNTRGAIDALGKIQDRYKGQTAPASREQAFIIYGNAVCCTMARTAAYQAGVSPEVLNELFQRYMELSVYGGASSGQRRQVYEMTATVCEQVQKIRTSSYSPLIRRTVSYLLENFTKELRLDKTAELMSVNKSYLSSLFARETGYGFTRYLNRIRLEKAAMDLRCSSLSVGRIAENVGIPDQNYFARIFRQTYGESPSEYRRK